MGQMGDDKNDRVKTDTVHKIESINAVEGFDPMSLAIEIGDLNEGGGVRYHMPVMTQIAWFRLKYPEGRISVSVKPGNNCFVAEARVYTNYMHPVDCFLAEGSAARGVSKEKASVSPREWAQTAAIGIALRNAGFGLQAAIAGESFEENALYELMRAGGQETRDAEAGQTPPSSGEADSMADGTADGVATQPVVQIPPKQVSEAAPTTAQTPTQAQAPALAPAPISLIPLPELSPLDKAMAALCPIMRYKDKTLGDMIRIDPGALAYVAKSGNKYGADVADYARLICETALQQASA